MSVMDTVASCIRAGITAPPGHKLVVCDLSAIESRVLGWLSGCTRLNNLFTQGLDPYKDFATEAFQEPYDRITKKQRTFAKPAVLGCGYRLGDVGLVKYADSMGVEMDKKQARHLVQTFRNVYHEVPAMWYWYDNAVHRVVAGETCEGYRVTMWRDDQFLFVRLPSGRNLYYYQPRIEQRIITIVDEETGEERRWATQALTYMGMNQFNRKWSRLDTHGGKTTEQVDQSTSRDILVHGMRATENDPICDLIGHVHDELIALAPEAQADEILKRMQSHMSTTPGWASGLLLGAEGYVAKRYRKE